MNSRHKTFLDWNGNVAFEVNESEIFYVNGTPYFSKGDAVRLITPYDKTKGMTVFMRVSSSGKPHLKSPKVLLSGKSMFSFNPSTTFPVCCINSIDLNHNLGYLNKGESIWSFYIKGDKVYTMNAVEVGTMDISGDELSLEWRSESETAFMVSEVLFVDGVISDIIQIRDYERYMVDAPRPVVPQTGKVRPFLSQSFAGHLFYDESIGHLIMWDGKKWKTTNGIDIK